MDMEIFWFSFLILTLLHPLGDFVIGNRRRFKGEFWIVLNPLHWLWDSSRFRKHGKYVYTQIDIGNNEVELVVKQPFWFWLGIDQFAHVILNIILAAFLEIVF